MSRVGKKPVAIPNGVTAKVDGQQVSAKGGKGELAFVVPEEVAVKLEDNAIVVDPRDDSKRARALWGTSRAMINNIVVGVSDGFEKRLEITGVGYRAAAAGPKLNLALGYSHDTPLARWYTGIRSQRLVDGPDEVHRWRTGANVIKAYEKYGTTAPACGGELFD